MRQSFPPKAFHPQVLRLPLSPAIFFCLLCAHREHRMVALYFAKGPRASLPILPFLQDKRLAHVLMDPTAPPTAPQNIIELTCLAALIFFFFWAVFFLFEMPYNPLTPPTGYPCGLHSTSSPIWSPPFRRPGPHLLFTIPVADALPAPSTCSQPPSPPPTPS